MNLSSGNSRQIISDLVDYMKSKGLIFKSINLNDSSPYAILFNDTSLGHRKIITKRSKWKKTGVVFFCSKDGIDVNNLVSNLNS